MPRTNFPAGVSDGTGNAGVLVATATVARTDTVAKDLFSLPAGARIVGIEVEVPVVSNAATTANVAVGVKGGSGTQYSTALDVKTAAGIVRPTTQAQVANWSIGSAAVTVTGTYAETGTASTAGGPFTVRISYAV